MQNVRTGISLMPTAVKNVLKCSSSVYTLLGEKQHKKSDKEAKAK